MFQLKKERINQKKIDSGTYGAVFPYQKDPSDHKWVVKRIHANDADEVLNSLPEIVLGFSCDHPCIVPLKGYNIEKRSEGDYWVYLKFPRMKENLKNKFDEQKKQKTPFSEQDIVQYFYSLVSAVGYLHEKKIYHRDIKPANVLLDHEGNAKLSDIGVAKYVGEEETSQHLTEKKGTIDYTAPEILQEKGKLTKENLRVNDVWGVGLVMLELCALERRIISPYASKEKIQEVLDNLEKRLKEIYNEKLVDLVFGLLRLDPNERMKIEDVKRILGEEYSYCRDLEIGSERYECEMMKENKKRLEEKYFNKAQEIIALIGNLKEEDLKIKNELREYQAFVKKFLRDIGKHYSENIEKLKMKPLAINYLKNSENSKLLSEIKPIQSLNENSLSTQILHSEEKEEEKSGLSDFSPRKSAENQRSFRAKINLLGHNGSGRTFFLTKSDRWQILDQDEKILETDFLALSNDKFSIRDPINECDVLLILYDITDKESFSPLKTEIERISIEEKKPILFLLGNKLELESERQVTKIEAEAFAKENGAIHFEISEATGENTEQFREELTKAVFRKYWPTSAGPAGKKVLKREDKADEKKESVLWRLFR